MSTMYAGLTCRDILRLKITALYCTGIFHPSRLGRGSGPHFSVSVTNSPETKERNEVSACY